MIILYEATNLINGKRYIGVTKQGLSIRIYKHLYLARNGKGRRLGAAVRKYGEENIRFRTIVVCPDYQYALNLERAYIGVANPEYNVTLGGEGVLGLKITEETRQKLSLALKSRPNPWIGRKHSEETKEKIRRAKLGCVGPWRGKIRPQETKEKFRQAKLKNPTRYWLGKKRSLETCAKISATKLASKRLEID